MSLPPSINFRAWLLATALGIGGCGFAIWFSLAPDTEVVPPYLLSNILPAKPSALSSAATVPPSVAAEQFTQAPRVSSDAAPERTGGEARDEEVADDESLLGMQMQKAPSTRMNNTRTAPTARYTSSRQVYSSEAPTTRNAPSQTPGNAAQSGQSASQAPAAGSPAKPNDTPPASKAPSAQPAQPQQPAGAKPATAPSPPVTVAEKPEQEAPKTTPEVIPELAPEVEPHAVPEPTGTNSPTTPTPEPEPQPEPPPAPEQPQLPTTAQLLQQALSKGDPSVLDAPASQLLIATLREHMERYQAHRQTLVQQIFANDPVYFDPKPGGAAKNLRAQVLYVTDHEKAASVITGNGSNDFAIASLADDRRYIAFALPVFHHLHVGDPYLNGEAIKRTVDWAVRAGAADPVSRPRKVVIATMSNGWDAATRFRDSSKAWFEHNYPGWTVTLCNTPSALASCAANADLVVAGKSGDPGAQAAFDFYVQHIKAGKAFIYTHENYESISALSQWLMPLLGAEMLAEPKPSSCNSGNWCLGDKAIWNSASEMVQSTSPLVMLDHLIRRDFDAIAGFSTCTSVVTCEAVLRNEMLLAARNLQAALTTLAHRQVPLFDEPGRVPLKMWLLLADQLRAEISYPMEVKSTEPNRFIRAFVADHLVYLNRAINAPQADLGSFVGTYTQAQSAATDPVQRRFKFDSPAQVYAAGMYLLPGKTVRIKRTDTGSAVLNLYVNPQSVASTRMFTNDWYFPKGYSRPKFLRSPLYRLDPGAELSFSSPYGGLLMLQTNSVGSVSLDIQGAASMANFDVAQGSDAGEFLRELEATPLPWTQVRTPFFSGVSLTPILKEGLAAYGNDLGVFLLGMDEYLIKTGYRFAGLQGTVNGVPADYPVSGEVTLDPAVANKCLELGWDCTPQTHPLPAYQRFTFDRYASCGSACSGNPIEVSNQWFPAAEVMGHELGHGLQPTLLRIYGSQSSEVSNNLVHMYTGWNYVQRTGRQAPKSSCSNYAAATVKLPGLLKKGLAGQASVKNELWFADTVANGRNVFYQQIAMLADELKAQAGLANGWNIYTLMYLQLRQFNAATTATWPAVRGKLGMGLYASKPSYSDGNDFMLMSLSFLLHKDFRPYFDLYGVTYSDAARDQVAAYGHTPLGAVFFPNTGHCANLTGTGKMFLN